MKKPRTKPESERTAGKPLYPLVGGAEMLPQRTLLDNLRASADHSSFIRAMEAAGLSGRLAAPGAHTVFAPTKGALAALPPGLVDALLDPRSRSEAARLAGLHVLAATRTRAQIAAEARAPGFVRYPTLSGEWLTLRMEGGRLALTDPNGRRALVLVGDIAQANGVLHIVDTVLLPRV